MSAEGHELLSSHSGSIEQLRGQVEMKKNTSRELERQACIVSELKNQVRSCESSWRLEICQQVSMTQPSACLGNYVDRLPLESLCQSQGVLSFCLSDQLCKLLSVPFGLWPMVIALGCRLRRLLLCPLKSTNFSPPLSDDNLPRYLHYSSNTGAHGNVPYYFQRPNTISAYGKMQID